MPHCLAPGGTGVAPGQMPHPLQLHLSANLEQQESTTALPQECIITPHIPPELPNPFTGAQVQVAQDWGVFRANQMRRKVFLTKNCSLCLSVSGVNSRDIGMISPLRMIMALQ